jgi:hypothetical protein
MVLFSRDESWVRDVGLETAQPDERTEVCLLT